MPDYTIPSVSSAVSLPPGVSSTHREYEANRGRWALMRDVVEGEDVIKERGTDYLPLPNGMSTSEYNAYKLRASFTGFTGRAIDAMLGLVGRKKPTFEAPEEVKELADDITLTGVPLDSFAMNALAEVLTPGRAGILVDYPVTPEEAMVRLDVENYGLRPYLLLYTAENILDWGEGRIGNRRVLTYLKLQDTFEEPLTPYSTQITTRVRIFRLVENEGRYVCSFEVYSIDPDQISGISGTTEKAVPLFSDFVYSNGEPLSYIPFFPIGPMENSMKVQRPPLLDMAFLNIHHYQASADRNHAVHWADVPTPVIIGQMLDDTGQVAKTIKLGPTSAINLQIGGSAEFLEMTGNGITPTKELMREYVDDMSVLGNKILAGDAKSTEAAETAAIHRSGEQAILATMANNVSIALTSAIKCMAEFMGMSDKKSSRSLRSLFSLKDPGDAKAVSLHDISYKLSTNYLPGNLDSQTFIALLGARVANRISDQEFYEAIVAGGLIRGDKSFEKHMEEIEALPPVQPVQKAGGLNITSATSGLVDPSESKEDDVKK